MKRLQVFVFVLLLSNLSLAAREIPINIKADKLKYSENSSLVTAMGSVEVVLEGIKINSDYLVMNTNTNMVTAEGNVKIKNIEYNGEGSFLSYSVDDETSEFNDYRTKVTADTIKGNIYVKAKTIKNKKKDWVGRFGELTTCDYAEHGNPHYLMAARKIEYYPKDKIIGRAVTMYAGPVPIFWFPYFEYDLKGRKKNNWSMGHNEIEGDFIKSFWDYPYGTFLLDLMSKKGTGYGIDNPYTLSSREAGSYYAYHLDEADTGISDWVYKIRYNLKTDQGSTVSLSHSFSKLYLIPGGRMDQSDYNASLKNKYFKANLDVLDNRWGNQELINLNLSNDNNNYSLYLNQGMTDPRAISSSQRFSHNQTIFDKNTTLNLSANYLTNISKVGIPGDERLDLSYDLNSNQSLYQLRIHEDWYMDLDRGLYTGDSNIQYLEKQPEITLSLNPVDLKLFELNSSLGYGYYHEVAYVPALGGNRDYATGRYAAVLSVDKTIPLVLFSSLSLSCGVCQYLYQPGDQMYSFSEDLGLNTNIKNIVTNDVLFTRGISEGNTPFLFDRLGTKYSSIRDTLAVKYLDKFKWTATGGYNYESKQYFNIDTSLLLAPLSLLTLNFVSGFDIENQKYLDLSTRATFSPFKGLNNQTTVLQDLNSGYLKNASNYLDYEMGTEKEWLNHWHFILGNVYNPQTQDFRLVDIMVEKDLHCWDLKCTYSDYRKEFAIVFTIKAMPGEQVGYAGNRGFYFDALEKALGDVKGEFQNASPQRY